MPHTIGVSLDTSVSDSPTARFQDSFDLNAQYLNGVTRRISIPVSGPFVLVGGATPFIKGVTLARFVRLMPSAPLLVAIYAAAGAPSDFTVDAKGVLFMADVQVEFITITNPSTTDAVNVDISIYGD